MKTGFTPILQRAVERVPGAIGAIFADWEGEAVDHFGHADRDELLVLTAHYGVIFNQLQSALHLFHFGDATEIVVRHDGVELLLRGVRHGYYLVVVASAEVHLATALRELEEAACALRAEMD
jgi:predicted regulator of Ras-like GTPase activity (Roadblock/LC7/MglB family)